MNEEPGDEFYVDQDGVLNFPVFVIRKEYFEMTTESKGNALKKLQDWINNEIEKL